MQVIGRYEQEGREEKGTYKHRIGVKNKCQDLDVRAMVLLVRKKEPPLCAKTAHCVNSPNVRMNEQRDWSFLSTGPTFRLAKYEDLGS